MAIGISNFFINPSNLVITSSVVLVSARLTSPVAANETQKIRYLIPVTVGATGGVRLQVLVPAGGVVFIATIQLNNTVGAVPVVDAAQTASVVFTNALANAGTHWVEIEVTVVNGVNAGDIDLQIAQNTADALSLTLLRGATATVTKL